MTVTAALVSASSPSTVTTDVLNEVDKARRNGPLQHIIIPPSPELLSRLQHAMSQAEPDLNEVARIASSDVAMSADLLRSANGPLYAAGQPAQTMGQAMNRLGLEQTAAIMTGFLARRAIVVPSSPQLKRFWERSTMKAVAMGYLAERLTGMSADLAHTYGLFCHVGLPVMAQSIRGYIGTMVEAVARIDRSFVATENINHRTDHAVVGALVARMWRLSPTVVAAIRLHHDLGSLKERASNPEVNTLIATGLLAEYIMCRHEGLKTDSDWTQHSGAALAWLQTSEAELAVWEDELRATLDAI